MKHVIPAAVALSLAAAGIAQAQTANTGNTGATSTTNSVGAGTSATPGSSPSTTQNSANTNTPGNAGAGASTTLGSPNTPDTTAGRGTTALGAGAVGSPNASRPNDGSTNNAVSTRSENNPGAPHAGANSFTEGQARSRIEDSGFKEVKDLKKDDQGVWRGQATKDGKQTSVALDYQGNVVGQ